MKATILIFLFTFLLCPSNAFANGGLPIIFLLNSYAFIIGAIFVLLIEYRYLQKTLVNVNKRQLFKAVASINIVSTLAGIIIVPIVLIFFKLEPIFYLITESTSDSKMSTIWLLSITFDLILAYALTVVIEYRLLKKYSFGDKFSISKIHGKVFERDELSFKIIPLFHPAATIYTRSRRDDLLNDFQKVKKLLTNKK
jgi:hypothetical protein